MRALLGLIAIAVLLLTLPGIRPVKALQYCDLSPQNCFRGGDGYLYYLAPGSPWHKAYRAGRVTLPEIIERTRKQRDCALHAANGFCRLGPPPGGNAAVQSPQRAAWGCGATDGKAKGRSWNYSNRTAASYRAVAECSSKSTHGRCRVVSCQPAVHTSYEAVAIWGANTPQ
jgi:hypothetical protein